MSGLEIILRVYEGRTLAATVVITRPIELGRRDHVEPPPYASIPGSPEDRLIIADLQENKISRKHLRVEPASAGKVKLTNVSSKSMIALSGGVRLAPGDAIEVELPAACELGERLVRLEAPPREELQLQSLVARTLAPGQGDPIAIAELFSDRNDSAALSAGGKEGDLLAWLQASIELFQCAASSAEFLPQAAAAACKMVGLDTAAVILRRDDDWTPAAVRHRDDATVSNAWQASRTMLGQVLAERRTFFNVPISLNAAQSLLGVQSLVAAPILDRQGIIQGVLYGERRSGGGLAFASPIRESEAKLFELLAYGVSTGLARVEQERRLIAERVRFEQFFTPELARLLQSGGDEILAAKEAEITVLFCDIKGFSRISARSGATLAIEWVREILSDLSDCVAEFQGVIVDYSGDSLEAIWGAPLEAVDHAARACRAARQMQARMPELNSRWEGRLGEKTGVSIGINSGPAQVGNIGSRRKFKYGAFGTTVNVASRVQGATKRLGVSQLLTESSAARLNDEFALRRLGAASLVNIPLPVQLVELNLAPDAHWPRLKSHFEQALACVEKSRFAEAQVLLNELAVNFPQDTPTRKLQQWIEQSASLTPAELGVVWNLDTK